MAGLGGGQSWGPRSILTPRLGEALNICKSGPGTQVSVRGVRRSGAGSHRPRPLPEAAPRRPIYIIELHPPAAPASPSEVRAKTPAPTRLPRSRAPTHAPAEASRGTGKV